MSQIIHCIILLSIVFVIAEIRNVLLYTDPQQPVPLTIWQETRNAPVDTGNVNNSRLSTKALTKSPTGPQPGNGQQTWPVKPQDLQQSAKYAVITRQIFLQ